MLSRPDDSTPWSLGPDEGDIPPEDIPDLPDPLELPDLPDDGGWLDPDDE